MLDDCRPALDALLDMDDGVEDGVAGTLDDIKNECLAIPSADILDELKEMQCPSETLNGVALTEVAAPACADTRDKCAAFIAAGLTCEHDLAPGGDNAGWCDESCGFCAEAGGRRRAQVAACKDFENQVQAVNTAFRTMM